MAEDIDIEEHDVFDNPQLRKIFPDIHKLKRELDDDDDKDECNLEIADDIDVEEHSVFDNPHLRKIFPDIVQLKREIDEDAPLTNIETKDLLQVKEEQSSYASQLPNATILQNGSNNQDKEICLEISNNIFRCKFCSKESEEEMCKQCFLEKEDDLAPASPFDSIVFHVVGDNKKIEEDTLLIDISDSEEELKHKTDTPNKIRRGIYKYSCEKCEYKCKTQYEMNKHFRTHKEKPYKCDHCDFRSAYKYSINLHTRAKHTKEKKYSCHLCDYRSAQKHALVYHMWKHYGEKPYKCDFCEYQAVTKVSIQHHVKYRHSKERNNQCDICERKFVLKTDLNKHRLLHIGEGAFSCDLCDYKGVKKRFLTAHIKRKHSPGNTTKDKLVKPGVTQNIHVKPEAIENDFATPEQTEIKFDTPGATGNKLATLAATEDRPVKSETTENFTTLETTDSQFAKLDIIEDKFAKQEVPEYKFVPVLHFKPNTGTNLDKVKYIQERPISKGLYKCHICKHCNLTKDDLKTHIKLIHKEEGYTCDICKRSFVFKTDIIKHSYIHTRESSKHTLWNGHLKKHIKSEHPSKIYTCDVCNFETVNVTLLDAHIRKHDEEIVFKCDICSYTCSQEDTFKFHCKVFKHETKINKLECKICGYKCVGTFRMIEHNRLHNGERPFKCDLCDHRSPTYSSLYRHKRNKHRVGSEYRCRLCGYTDFSQKGFWSHSCLPAPPNAKPVATIVID